MSSAITERIADICDLARLNTELVVMARRRGQREAEQINEYLRSAGLPATRRSVRAEGPRRVGAGSACVVAGDRRRAWGSS